MQPCTVFTFYADATIAMRDDDTGVVPQDWTHPCGGHARWHAPHPRASGAYLTLWAIATAGILPSNSTLHASLVERALVCSDGDADVVSQALTSSGHAISADAILAAVRRLVTLQDDVAMRARFGDMTDIATRETRRFQAHRHAREDRLSTPISGRTRIVALLERLKARANAVGTGPGMGGYPEWFADQLGWAAPVPQGFFGSTARVECDDPRRADYRVWPAISLCGKCASPRGHTEHVGGRCKPRGVRDGAPGAARSVSPFERGTIGVTLLGGSRLDDLQFAIEDAVAREVDGDVVQTGVNLGGSLIFASAALTGAALHPARHEVPPAPQQARPPAPQARPQAQHTQQAQWTRRPAHGPSPPQPKQRRVVWGFDSFSGFPNMARDGLDYGMRPPPYIATKEALARVEGIARSHAALMTELGLGPGTPGAFRLIPGWFNTTIRRQGVCMCMFYVHVHVRVHVRVRVRVHVHEPHTHSQARHRKDRRAALGWRLVHVDKGGARRPLRQGEPRRACLGRRLLHVERLPRGS